MSATQNTMSATQNTMSATQNTATDNAAEVMSHLNEAMPPNRYFAGLVDAQLTISTTKNESARAVLVSQDPRVADQISSKFRPTRITIVKRPNKADQCTILFTGDQLIPLLEFAVEHCVMKRDLARKTLDYINKNASVEELKNVPLQTDLDEVDVDWCSGYFDVRGVVNPTVPATENTKKKRGAVKFVLPKHERFVVPALQRVFQGRVKKSSPCRLVFDTKETIKTFLETAEGHVLAKKDDFRTLV